MFTEECLYNLHDEDQHDVNKLFGFSIGLHHKNSYRFGWRPILEERKIEIVGYEYRDGVRQPTMPIVRINIDEVYEFILVYEPTNIRRTEYVVIKMATEEHKSIENFFVVKRRFGFGYKLGIYFGGNEKAPHDMTIYQVNY